MKEEILKTFDLFIENANTKELKELIKDIKEMYEENERLHSIINNTIKYCEESNLTLKSHYFMDVIKLLKGEKI